MANETVTISEATVARLRELAQRNGVSLEQALALAVKDQHDRAFWDAVNVGYDALRGDPSAWAALEAERKLWDGTLLDGLDLSELWTEDGNAIRRPAQEE